MNKQQSAIFKDKQFGFYIYLFVESIMFATLFATYLIFTPSSAGPSPTEVFEAKSVILSSICLLSSSGTLIIAEKGLEKRQTAKVVFGIGVTLLLGLLFLSLEVHEFYKYAQEGYSIGVNNFLSSFYVLVGLHAVHVMFGLFWMILLLIQYTMKISNGLYREKQSIFAYYWHFVDIIWVFIVILVYLPYLV